MLEGFVPRDQTKLGRVPNGSPYRFNLLMSGQIDATTLTEPYISLAEKKGCRLVISAFHHGTEVASNRIDAETYSAFNRAVREAVRRINANKRAYLHYFIDYYKNKDPEIAKLTQRTFDWMKSWGFLEDVCEARELVNMSVQQRVYEEPSHQHAAVG
jgi:ABC-type nitrate/sulfonate/bicarbonate transport system substrate-binding protein